VGVTCYDLCQSVEDETIRAKVLSLVDAATESSPATS
jgi:hypothetical protein